LRLGCLNLSPRRNKHPAPALEPEGAHMPVVASSCTASLPPEEHVVPRHEGGGSRGATCSGDFQVVRHMALCMPRSVTLEVDGLSVEEVWGLNRELEGKGRRARVVCLPYLNRRSILLTCS
jgi:hypothetical protein